MADLVLRKFENCNLKLRACQLNTDEFVVHIAQGTYGRVLQRQTLACTIGAGNNGAAAALQGIQTILVGQSQTWWQHGIVYATIVLSSVLISARKKT